MAASWRGGVLENSHLAHIVVADEDGSILREAGDGRRLTLVRSAAKPAQAVAILATDGFRRAGFDEADLALMCASHSSEEVHLAQTRRMLAKLGAGEEDLRCGGHPPLSEQVQRDWLRRGFRPTPGCSNCSGKHVGMLAAQRAMAGTDPDYHRPDHPLQVQVRQSVAASFGLSDDAVHWGLDGCNLPTPAVPLQALAGFYARLAAAADDAAPADAAEGVPALARVYRAMVNHPHLIGGSGRFCTALLEAGAGTLVGKVGADASYAIGVRASACTRALGASGALGLAIKIEDGNQTVLYAVVEALLAHLGLLEGAALQQLAPFRAGPLRNTVGEATGHLAVYLPFTGEDAGAS